MKAFGNRQIATRKGCFFFVDTCGCERLSYFKEYIPPSPMSLSENSRVGAACIFFNKHAFVALATDEKK